MNTFFENIEPYLEDTLDSVAKGAFENELTHNETLRDALAKEKTIRLVQYQINKEVLRDRLTKLNTTKVGAPNAKIVAMNWRKYAIAASIIGLLFTSYLLFITPKSIDYQQLASENNIEYPIPNIQGGQQTNDVKKQIFQAIEQKQYPKALDLFKTISKTEMTDELRFFQAYSLLQNKNYESAVIAFSTMPKGIYQDATDWYSIVGNLYLQKDVKDKVEKIKNNPKHTYQNQANQLYEKLK